MDRWAFQGPFTRFVFEDPFHSALKIERYEHIHGNLSAEYGQKIHGLAKYIKFSHSNPSVLLKDSVTVIEMMSKSSSHGFLPGLFFFLGGGGSLAQIYIVMLTFSIVFGPIFFWGGRKGL